MAVYFIQAGGEGGAVKIGYSSNVANRITKMQTDSPFEIRLIRVLEGGQDVESEIHRRLTHLHKSREWFEFSEEMLGDLGYKDAPFSLETKQKSESDHPLSRYLAAKSMTQAEFAALISVGQPTVSKWLRRERFPRTAVLRKIISVTNGAIGASDFLVIGEAA